LVTILLYRHNGDGHNDDIARRYMRQAEGEEELQVVVGGSSGRLMSRWLRNKGCVLCCHEAANEVIRKMRWGSLSLPPPAQVHDDLLCTGGACDDVDRWE
jgi:hypothetical protein